MKQGDKLFIVDLTSVSFFSPNVIKNISRDEGRYYAIPFLFLISSYLKNSAINIANDKLKFIEKKSNYSWDVYCYKRG